MSSTRIEALRESVRSFPDSAGVYIMKSGRGRVIYVGKARNLSARVRSYFAREERLDPKTEALMASAAAIDYIATANEVEALILECTLIKEHRPRYNIRLKDDKRYPYLKLTTPEEYPRLLIVRSVQPDGAEYFGPYTDSTAVRRTVRAIRTIFPLRDCAAPRVGPAKRECLNFHIGRCAGPCTGRITPEEYGEIVSQVRLFLRGRSDALEASLKKRMWRLSRERRYEEAAAVRDQLASLDRMAQRQVASLQRGGDADAAAVAREGDLACGVVLRIREGSILGSEYFMMPAGAAVPDSDVLEAFVELYYHSATDVPPRIVVPMAIADRSVVEAWLGRKAGRRVAVTVALRGAKRRLVDLARTNAELRLAAGAKRPAGALPALRALKEALRLPRTPVRIEVYDVSNIQGADAVGSLVLFVDGMPRPAGYRHFRIKTVSGADDFAMMREILDRRFAHLVEGKERRPDLIVVDGGRGQLGAARSALDAAEIAGIPLAALAKRNEELYLEGRPEPLALPRRSEALKLLQRMRNEAHRFAVSYHRALRRKRTQRSALDEVPGIGERRKTALLVAFGSVEAIRAASVEEIAAVRGIGGKLAEVISRRLRG